MYIQILFVNLTYLIGIKKVKVNNLILFTKAVLVYSALKSAFSSLLMLR